MGVFTLQSITKNEVPITIPVKISKECLWTMCKNCRWYCKFEGVCVNGKSDYVADFVDEEHLCRKYEERKER